MALNPLRIYTSENNDASPLHDAIGKVLNTRRDKAEGDES